MIGDAIALLFIGIVLLVAIIAFFIGLIKAIIKAIAQIAASAALYGAEKALINHKRKKEVELSRPPGIKQKR